MTHFGLALDKFLRLGFDTGGRLKLSMRIRTDAGDAFLKPMIEIFRDITGREPYYRHGNARLITISEEGGVKEFLERAIPQMTSIRRRVAELGLLYISSRDAKEMASLMFEIAEAQSLADAEEL